jgi:hypothetical protein
MRKPLYPGDELRIQYDVGPFCHDFTPSFNDGSYTHPMCIA